MRNMLIILLVLGAPVLAFTQSPDTLWTRTYGGSSSEYANSVMQTTDGGYIVAGSIGDWFHDSYLVKTNSQGDMLWTRTYGAGEGASSVMQTTDGGYIAAGATRSFGAGNNDFYLVKTNSQGDTLWTRTYGGSSSDVAVSVEQTADGGYIVAGVTGSFGVGSDFYLVKTNSQGDTLWTRTYGGSSYDGAFSVEQTADGGYIVAGTTQSFGAGSCDFYLVKTNSQGDTLWTRTYGGSSDDRAYSVEQTTDGGYIVAGYTRSFGAGLQDLCLVKTNSQGDTLWTRTYGGSSDDGAYSVEQTADGGYIVASWTYSFGAGWNDFWLVKTNSQGDTLWTRTYGGSMRDYAHSVEQTADGGYIVAGATQSFGAGNYDFWLVKTGPDPDWPGLHIVVPNGGEEWLEDQSHSTEWTSSGSIGLVNIKMNRNYPDGIWEIIAENTPNDNEETITVTAPPSDHCRIKIESVNNPTIYDVSDNDFAIVNPESLITIDPFSIIRAWNQDYYQSCPRGDQIAVRVYIRNNVSETLENVTFQFTWDQHAPDTTLHPPEGYFESLSEEDYITVVFGGIGPYQQSDSLILRITSISGIPVNIERSTTMTTYATNRNSGSDLFELDRDAYYFDNEGGLSYYYLRDEIYDICGLAGLWSPANPLIVFFTQLAALNGWCYGMSATAGVYFENPTLLPGDADSTWELLTDGVGVTENIFEYQVFQFLQDMGPNQVDIAWARIQEMIMQNHPAILMLAVEGEPGGHAVLAYRSIYNHQTNIGWLYCYENDIDEGDGYPEKRQMRATYKLDDLEFDYSYGEYNKPGSVLPVPLVDFCDIMEDVLNSLLADLWDGFTDWLGLGCPARMLITDEFGRRIGYVNGEDFVNEIPGASMELFGSGVEGDSITACYMPSSLDYTVEIFGTATGNMDFEWARAIDSTTLMPLAFRELSMTTESRAYFAVNDTSDFTMEIDLDGDGTVDTTAYPQSQLLVLPGSIDFDTVIVDSSADMELLVINNGTADLLVTDIISSDSAFTVFLPETTTGMSHLDEVSFTVGARDTQQVIVRFSPSAEMDYEGILTIYSDLPDVLIPVSGTGRVESSIDNPGATEIPKEFALNQSYPNPFNPITNIRYDVAQTSHITLTIYNLLGQQVTRLMDKQHQPGSHTISWNAAGQPSGLYFCRMQAGGFVQTRKLVLMK